MIVSLEKPRAQRIHTIKIRILRIFFGAKCVCAQCSQAKRIGMIMSAIGKMFHSHWHWLDWSKDTNNYIQFISSFWHISNFKPKLIRNGTYFLSHRAQMEKQMPYLWICIWRKMKSDKKIRISNILFVSQWSCLFGMLKLTDIKREFRFKVAGQSHLNKNPFDGLRFEAFNKNFNVLLFRFNSKFFF